MFRLFDEIFFDSIITKNIDGQSINVSWCTRLHFNGGLTHNQPMSIKVSTMVLWAQAFHKILCKINNSHKISALQLLTREIY